MKALSIQQPWAWAVLYAGKNVENRSWPTHYRGTILIHTGRRRDPTGEIAVVRIMGKPIDHHLTELGDLGCFLGTAELFACIRYDCGALQLNPWASGEWCFLLRNPRAFKCPIPWPGRLGFFDVDEDQFRGVQYADGSRMEASA